MDWLLRLNGASKNLGDGLEILSWSYSPALFDNVPHRHTFFEICLVGNWGEGVFSLEDARYAIAPGDVFFARPGQVHQIQNTLVENTLARRLELFWVCFVWSGQTRGESGALWRDFAESDVALRRDEGTLRTLWNTLQIAATAPEFRGKNEQLAALQRALLFQIAALGARHAETESLPPLDPHRLARQGARYIHDNLSRRVSVAEVAAHLHLSPRHFGRLFHDWALKSPSQFITLARLDKARHLLRGSSLSIKEIAQTVGYDDVHHFTRVFSREMGVSPGAFRGGKDAPQRQSPGAGEFV